MPAKKTMQWNVVMEDLGVGGRLRRSDGGARSRDDIYQLRAMFSLLFQLVPKLPKYTLHAGFGHTAWC